MAAISENVQTAILPDLTKTATQVTTVQVTPEAAVPKPQTRPTPKLENPYTDDVAFARILEQYLPAEVKSRVDGEMSGVAQFAISKEAMDWVADTERSPPQVQHWDSWGEKKDELVTSQGWKNAWRWGKTERYIVFTRHLNCTELAKLIW